MTGSAAKRCFLTLALAVGIGLPAHAAVITFDGLAGTAMPGSSFVGSTWTTFAAGTTATVDGFQFRSSGPEHLLGAAYSAACCGGDFGPLAYNGTDYLIGVPDITVNKVGNGAFSLNGFDLVEWDNTFTAFITLTTAGPSGPTTQILPLSLFSNNFITTGNDFTHFSLMGYGNVVAFTLTGSVNWAYIAMDNLDVGAAVAAPASLPLLGLGLLPFAFARHRARARNLALPGALAKRAR
jgi:hypothetical protein